MPPVGLGVVFVPAGLDGRLGVAFCLRLRTTVGASDGRLAPGAAGSRRDGTLVVVVGVLAVVLGELPPGGVLGRRGRRASWSFRSTSWSWASFRWTAGWVPPPARKRPFRPRSWTAGWWSWHRARAQRGPRRSAHRPRARRASRVRPASERGSGRHTLRSVMSGDVPLLWSAQLAHKRGIRPPAFLSAANHESVKDS